jgi:hypothetical protein
MRRLPRRTTPTRARLAQLQTVVPARIDPAQTPTAETGVSAIADASASPPVGAVSHKSGRRVRQRTDQRGILAYAVQVLVFASITLQGASVMGKYLVGWILGVPVIVLVIIYLIFN